MQLIDSCITQLTAQGAIRTCDKSQEEGEYSGVGRRLTEVHNLLSIKTVRQSRQPDSQFGYIETVQASARNNLQVRVLTIFQGVPSLLDSGSSEMLQVIRLEIGS